VWENEDRVNQQRCPMNPDKMRYRSERDVAVVSRQTQLRWGVRLYHYRCSWCGDWHLTSQPNDES
jgi:hypothetical protein